MNWRFVPACEKLRFTISSPSHGFDSRIAEQRVELFQVATFENRFDGADLRARCG